MSSRAFDKAIIAVFAVCLGVPWLLGIGKFLTYVSTNFSGSTPAVASQPVGTDVPYEILPYDRKQPDPIDQLQDQLTHNYGGREILMQTGVAARRWGFGGKQVGHVLLGHEGWLFYYGDRTANYLENVEVTKPERIAAWVEALKQEADFCAARGARYVVAIGPNKESIYPEYLPATVQRSSEPNVLDLLIEATRDCENLHLVDLRPQLRAAKSEYPTYYLCDTHWNGFGGLVATQVICQRLARWYPGVELHREDYQIVDGKMVGGDLFALLGMHHAATPTPEVRPRIPEEAVWFSFGPQAFKIRTQSDRGAVPRAYILRDSFAGAILPCLASRFQEAMWQRDDDFSAKEVEEFQPDLVLRIFVERKLASKPFRFIAAKQP